MKLAQVDNHDFDAQLPEAGTQIQFKLQQGAHLFRILSDGIYTDKITAVIRELSCNAADAHIAVGTPQKPILVKLPNRLDMTFFVEDEGTGIDPEKIGDIYWTYGSSTKTESNEQTGALGLGSKSPFAYTKSSFLVKNRYQGTETVYFCFINEQGVPGGSVVSTGPATKPNGVTVEFAVRTNDLYEFHQRAKKFFRYWDVKPNIVDYDDVNDQFFEPFESNLTGTDWFFDGRMVGTEKKAIAVQGSVPYPINYASIPNLSSNTLAKICALPIVIKFPLGQLSFAVSREELSYDDRTCAVIKKKLAAVAKDVTDKVKEKLLDFPTKFAFVTGFKGRAEVFASQFGYSGAYMVEDLCDYIFGGGTSQVARSSSSFIEFQGEKYLIKELVDGIFKVEKSGYLPFSISLADNVKGKKVSVSSLTKMRTFFDKDHDYLIRTAVKPLGILAKTTYVDSPYKQRKGSSWGDWQSLHATKLPAKGEAFKTHHQFLTMLAKTEEVVSDSVYKLPLYAITHSKLVVFNDMKTVGTDRLKAHMLKHKIVSALYVQFNSDEIDADAVRDQVEAGFADYLDDATFVNVSELSDDRVVKSKAPRDQSSLDLSTVVFAAYSSSAFFYNGMSTTIAIQNIHVPYEGSLVYGIDELQASAAVPFLYRHKGIAAKSLKDLEDRNSYHHSRIYQLMSTLLATGDLKDLVGELDGEMFEDPARVRSANNRASSTDKDRAVMVLRLTPSEVTKLTKLGVKLVNFAETLEDRVRSFASIELQKKFEQLRVASTNKILADTIYGDFVELGGQGIVKKVPHALLDTKFYKRLAQTVEGYRSSDRTLYGDEALEAVKMAALTNVEYYPLYSINDDAERIMLRNEARNEIEKSYPLLKHINLHCFPKNQLGEIFKYVEACKE